MATVEARPQPDDDLAVQSFLTEFSKEPGSLWRIGRSGAGNNIEKKYISNKTLQQRLDVGRVQELLNALFKGRDEHPPDAGRVQQYYLRTFAILTRIGFGRMILHFIKRQLKDSRLPYLSKPSDFPSSSNQRDLYSEFYKEQWGFCAQLMEYDMGYQLEPNVILPILRMEVIYEEGGSAIMYKIEVDEDYNEILPGDDEDLAEGHQHRNTFALKHYRTQEAKEYYETESGAFRRLRYQNRPRRNIIAFYGGFEQENSYNIILEYADGGNLDQYMELTPSPTNRQERHDFWINFLDIFDGLAVIHGDGADVSNDLQILLGWHQDINPTNILIKTRPHAKSPYDCYFKIADLGLSHFRKHTLGLQRLTDNDTFGTRAYGAPETYRADLNIAKRNLRVKQDVDIWSFGCVLSEVVTWACQGWGKVVLYRQLRSQEVEALTGQREDRFHTDGQLLQAVHDSHVDNKENVRQYDGFTPTIIDGLVLEMMQIKSQARPNAQYLYEKSTRIVRDVHRSSNGVPITRPFGSLRRTTPTKMPPQLPPHYRREGSGGSGHSTPSSPYLAKGPGAHSPPLMQGPSNTEAAVSHETWDTPVLRQSRVQSAGENQHLRSYSSHDHDEGQLPQWPGQTRSTEGSFESQRIAPHRSGDVSEDSNRASQAPRRAETRNLPLNDNASSAYHNAGLTRASYSETSYVDSSSNVISTAAGKRPMHNHPGPSPQETEIKRPSDWKAPPELSLQEALGLLNKCLPLPDADRWLEELKGRDHAFVVDNSVSSQQIRENMRNVLKVLASVIRPADPDGPDLYFTGPYCKHKRQSVQAMLKTFDSTPLHKSPDMRGCLAQILEKYQGRFGKLNLFEKMRNPKQTRTKQPRKLNLYILTDGIWQPNTDLVQEIRTQVAHLLDRRLTDKQIGIQFIRFGNAPQSIQKMRKLDSELHLDLDIVDTTPANGNIWKMLHGAINPWFDDDPQVEDSQPGYHKRTET